MHSDGITGEEKRRETYLGEMRHLSLIQGALDLVELSLMSVSERMDTLRIVYKGLMGVRSTTETLTNLMGELPLDPSGIRDLVEKLVNSSRDVLAQLRLPEGRLRFEFHSTQAESIITDCQRRVSEDLSVLLPSVPPFTGETVVVTEDGREMMAADGGTMSPRAETTRGSWQEQELDPPREA